MRALYDKKIKIIVIGTNINEVIVENPIKGVLKLATRIFSRTPKEISKKEETNVRIQADHSSDFLNFFA